MTAHRRPALTFGSVAPADSPPQGRVEVEGEASGHTRRTTKRTELRRTSAQGARGLAKEAAEREWRVFLTAKFDRTWRAMIRFRAKVGATRFRELIAELPSTIENIGSSDQRGVAELILSAAEFSTYLAAIVDT